MQRPFVNNGSDNCRAVSDRVAAKHPGNVLRSPVAEQEVEPTTWAGGRPGYEVRSRPRCRWPEQFDVLDHLWENHSPPCGWAIPRSAFVDQGLAFDESLPVLEDWDVLMQAVLWCGVADTGEVTAVWRRWITGDSSTSVHSDIEWDQARTAIIAKFDAEVIDEANLPGLVNQCEKCKFCISWSAMEKSAAGIIADAAEY